MARVSWTPQAADDFEDICLFIARDTPQIAAAFADRVVTAADRLESHPRLGRVVSELGLDRIREILVGSYSVIYRVRNDEVHVLTVHHGARLLDASKIPADG
jgi:plasmid stabilization system protein ParE